MSLDLSPHIPDPAAPPSAITSFPSPECPCRSTCTELSQKSLPFYPSVVPWSVLYYCHVLVIRLFYARDWNWDFRVSLSKKPFFLPVPEFSSAFRSPPFGSCCLGIVVTTSTSSHPRFFPLSLSYNTSKLWIISSSTHSAVRPQPRSATPANPHLADWWCRWSPRLVGTAAKDNHPSTV